jgi:hypothetical protein
VRSAIGDMRRRFDLERDPLDPVPEYDDFTERLRGLPSLRRNAYLPPQNADPADNVGVTD